VAPPTIASPTPSAYRSLPLDGTAFGVSYGFGAAWVQVDPPVDQVVKVDATTNTITMRVEGGRNSAIGEDAVWVPAGDRGLLKIDPGSSEVLMTVKVDASYVSLGAGAAWVPFEGGVVRVSAKSGKIRTIRVSGLDAPKSVRATPDGVWLANKGGSVFRVDPATNQVVTEIKTGAGAHDILVTEGAVWVTNYQANTVSRIDPRTNKVVATIEGVGSGVGIAFCDGSVWVSRLAEGIYRIDPSTNAAELAIPSLENLYGLACGDGELWISSASSTTPRVFRVPLP